MEGKNYKSSRSLATFILFLGNLCFAIAFIIIIVSVLGYALFSLAFFSLYFVGVGVILVVGVTFLWFGFMLRNSAIQSEQAEKNGKMLIVLNEIQQQLSQLTTQNQKSDKITSVSSDETLKDNNKQNKKPL